MQGFPHGHQFALRQPQEEILLATLSRLSSRPCAFLPYHPESEAANPGALTHKCVNTIVRMVGPSRAVYDYFTEPGPRRKGMFFFLIPLTRCWSPLPFIPCPSRVTPSAPISVPLVLDRYSLYKGTILAATVRFSSMSFDGLVLAGASSVFPRSSEYPQVGTAHHN